MEPHISPNVTVASKKLSEIRLNGENYSKTNDIKISQLSAKSPTIKGKFIFVGDKKFHVKGVSYGAFEPDENKNEYFDQKKLEADFALMAANGINTVRIPHTSPPEHLLDIAHKHGLMVMISLSAEQYVGYLIDRQKTIDLEAIIEKKLKTIKNHPALLCASLGNEINASMVRWIGPKRIEKYLKSLYNIVKKACPELIVTYVNYPTTEYLKLPFLDLLCFNVYLEKKVDFENYLYRLQNLAGNRPLMMGEIGLDSLRNGEEKQAQTLTWQIESTIKCGCAGLFIFSWTDEWYRGEEEVDDWAFGLTTKIRESKPALIAVSDSYKAGPYYIKDNLPKISVIVCSYNGAKTLNKCFEELSNLNYPNYEIIFIDDGSTDDSLSLASKYNIRSFSIKNAGLSYARNLGLKEASGEIIAYIDDDAFPDPDWLYYVALDFIHTDFAAIGGPNICPEDANLISECVNNAPGSPTHVLHSDRIAEHIPGCNMAFRRAELEKIGGFDTQFRVAGDDVDVCWKMQDNGGKIGFSPSAVVWHQRRETIRDYWKQQYGYGKAEALLEKKWPNKYNNYGHRSWGGRIYGDGSMYLSRLNKSKIYGGIWGSAPFQSIYDLGKRNFLSLTLMPEWYIICVTLLCLSIIGFFWKPLLALIPIFIICGLIPLSIVIPSIIRLKPNSLRNKGWFVRKKFQLITILLFMIQPLARLFGRLRNHLTPWRRYSKSIFSLKVYGKISIWSEKWISPEVRLEQLETDLKKNNSYVYKGGNFDRWDIGIKGGAFGGIKVLMASEDHAKGTQYLRFKIFPRISSLSKYLLLFLLILIGISIIDEASIAYSSFSSILILLLLRIYLDCSTAAGCCMKAIEKQRK